MLNSKAREEMTHAFISALKEDVIPWRKCWSAAPVSITTGKEYRGVNNLMLSFQAAEKGYADTRWMTFQQAQNNGWRVRMGETPTRVEYWHYYDKRRKEAVDRDEVRRIQAGDPERMRDIRLAAHTYSVFNARQVEGVPPPARHQGNIYDPTVLKENRGLFLSALGVSLREGGDRAYYDPVSDKIIMPFPRHFDSDQDHINTLLHEAGHATGHSSRLDRDMSGTYGSEQYAREELRAEIASAFTAQALHTACPLEESPHFIQHKAYIQSWISILEQDPNELFAAIKDAEKISDHLMEHGALKMLSQPLPAAEPEPEEDVEWEL